MKYFLISLFIFFTWFDAKAQFVVTRCDSNGFYGSASIPVPGSFARAIQDINNSSGNGPFTITFNLSGCPASAPYTINAKNPNLLLIKKDNVTIDGSSQPGYQCAPIVRIVGPGFNDGIYFKNVRNGVVKALQIEGFGSSIVLDSGGSHRVIGNWIGTDSTGSALGKAGGRGNSGIKIMHRSDSNLIGSSSFCDRNVICGHLVGIQIAGENNRILNNFIGIGSNGASTLGNYYGIDNHGSKNIIGGLLPEERNIISYNRFFNIGLGFVSGVADSGTLLSDSCSILNNYLGTDSSGTAVQLIPNFNGYRNILVMGANATLVRGNVFASRYLHHIEMNNCRNYQILGNYFGTDKNGNGSNKPLGFSSTGAGISIYNYNANGRNQINDNIVCNSSNDGMEFYGVRDSAQFQLYNNRVGIDLFGNACPNNGMGIRGDIGGMTIGGNQAGQKNYIAYNKNYGAFGYNSTIGNEVFCNLKEGIGIWNYYPPISINTLSNADSIIGTCLPNFRIHIYEIDSCHTCGSIYAQGMYLIDSVLSDASGNWKLKFPSPVNKKIVVTSSGKLYPTNKSISTSAFSFCYDLSGILHPAAKILVNNIPIDSSYIFDFGVTTVNSPIIKNFVLKNTGTSVLALNKKTLPTGFNILTAFPALLGAGDSIVVQIKITATQAGSFNGKFSLQSNIAGNDTTYFKVKGIVNPAKPSKPDLIAGNKKICTGSTESYSVTDMPGTTYTWTLSGGGVLNNSGNSATINWINPGTYTLRVIPSNISGNGPDTSIVIAVENFPSQPGLISGPNSTFQGTTGNYSVTNTSGINYTWMVNGGGSVTGSGNSAAVNWTTAGTYTLTVTPDNSCGTGAYRTLSVTVNMPTGLINNAVLSNVTIYPNPNNGNFTFELTSPGNYKVKISTILGQEIYSEVISETQNINLTNIQSGIYYINISSDMSTFVKKIFVR